MKKNKRNTVLNGILWSSKGIAGCVPNLLLVTYLSFYATDVLGMNATLVATILLLTKLFDGVTDLIAGFIVDNTHTKIGKGRPYDICIIFIGVFTVLLFAAPKSGTIVQVIWLSFMYIMLQAVFITLLSTAENVYLLHAFPDEKERNTTYTVSLIFGQVFAPVMGILLPIIISQAGTDRIAWIKSILVLVVPTTLFGMIRFFFIKEADAEDSQIIISKKESESNGEKVKSKKKKEKIGFIAGIKLISVNSYIFIFTIAIFIIIICSGLLNSVTIYYFQYIVGDINKMAVTSLGAYAMLVMLFLFVPLSNKFGKSNIMKVGLAIAVVGNLIRWFGGANIVTITIGMGLLLFGIVPISMYFPLFLFDIMDYGEWKTGKRLEGVYTAFPSFANKVANGLSVSLGMFIVGAAGYDGKASVQPETAINAINICYNMLPTILMIVMLAILIFFYDIDKKMPQVKAELNERKGVRKV